MRNVAAEFASALTPTTHDNNNVVSNFHNNKYKRFSVGCAETITYTSRRVNQMLTMTRLYNTSSFLCPGNVKVSPLCQCSPKFNSKENNYTETFCFQKILVLILSSEHFPTIRSERNDKTCIELNCLILVKAVPLNQQCGPTDRCEDPNADCMSKAGISTTLCLCIETHFEKANSGFCSALDSNLDLHHVLKIQKNCMQ